MMRKLITYIMILLLIMPSTLVISQEAKEKVVRVAIIRQRWDPLDMTIGRSISNNIHKIILRGAEVKYHVKFKIYEFWDGWNGGDVQNGFLFKKKIDVIIAPGGLGFWCTPEKYRREIKRFVYKGGGFYGICGDSIFGSLGIKYLNSKYADMASRVLGVEGVTPMLKLANVYSDGNIIIKEIKKSVFLMKIDMLKFLTELPSSRAPIYIIPSTLDIQEPYFGKEIEVMLGAPPMIDGPAIRSIFMSKVFTIALLRGYDKPYSHEIEGKKAIIATTYGKGRVILSAVHPELTVANNKAHDIYNRNVLWLAKIIN